MKRLLAFVLAEGGSVVVEVDDSDPGYERVARGSKDVIADSGRHFASALDVIRPTADALVDKVERLAVRPETVQVQFGVRLSAEAGAVIASTQAEGHLQVTLTWTPGRASASNVS